jgi:hypothetical protein
VLGQSDCGDEIGQHCLLDLRREFAEFDRAAARVARPMTPPVAMSQAANSEVAPWRGPSGYATTIRRI